MSYKNSTYDIDRHRSDNCANCNTPGQVAPSGFFDLRCCKKISYLAYLQTVQVYGILQ